VGTALEAPFPVHHTPIVSVAIAATRGGRAASAEQQSGTHREAEVVPGAVVVNLVDVDAVLEERDDEGDRRNRAVPESEPEARDDSIARGRVDDGVGTGGAPDHQDEGGEGQHERQILCDAFHGSSFAWPSTVLSRPPSRTEESAKRNLLCLKNSSVLKV